MSRISETADSARQAIRNEVVRVQGVQTKAPAVKMVGPLALAAGDGMESPQPRGVQVAVPIEHLPTAAQAASPFLVLAAGGTYAGLPPRTLAQPLPMEHDVSPASNVQQKLRNFEAAVAKLGGSEAGCLLRTSAKVREGMMLVLSDGLQVHARPDSRVPRDLVSHLGEIISAEKTGDKALAAAQSAMFSAKSSFPLGMDINAFVQAVLRESYLLQCEILKDYSERVEFYTQLRKKIRDQLSRARKLRTELKDGEELPAAFLYVSYDATTGNEGTWAVAQEGAGGEGSQGEGGESQDAVPGQTGSGFSGELDEMGGQASGDERVREVPTDGFTPFGSCGNASTAQLQQFIHALDANRDAGKQWPSIWNDAGNATATDVASGIAGLPLAELISLVVCAGNAWDAKRWASCDVVLTAVAQNLTYEQAEQIKQALSGSPYFWDQLVARNPSLPQLMERCENERRQLPPEFQAGGAYATVGALLAEVLAEGRNPNADGNRRNTVANELASLMWELPGPVARAVVRKLVEEDSPFAQRCLFASDPKELFAGQTPDQWKCLAEVEGAQGFYQAWAEVGLLEAQQKGRSYGRAEKELSSDALSQEPETPTIRRSSTMTTEDEQNGVESQEQTDVPPGGGAFNAAQMDDYIKELESQLETVGGDSQLANADLQNVLQQQQQILQMMSNISKMLHDTAMSIIRKIGA